MKTLNTYEDDFGLEYVDFSNNVNWYDKKLKKHFPQKIFAHKANMYGSPELIDGFDDLMILKKYQNSFDSFHMKTLNCTGFVDVDTQQNLMSFWLIEDETENGHPIVNTLKIATVFGIKHKKVIKTLNKVIKHHRLLKHQDAFKAGLVKECRYVIIDEGQKRHKYFEINGRILDRVLQTLPTDRDVGLNVVLTGLFLMSYTMNNGNTLVSNPENVLSQAISLHYKKYHHTTPNMDKTINNIRHITLSLLDVPRKFRGLDVSLFTVEARIILRELDDLIIGAIFKSKEKLNLENSDGLLMLIPDVMEIFSYGDKFITTINNLRLEKLLDSGAIDETYLEIKSHLLSSDKFYDSTVELNETIIRHYKKYHKVDLKNYNSIPHKSVRHSIYLIMELPFKYWEIETKHFTQEFKDLMTEIQESLDFELRNTEEAMNLTYHDDVLLLIPDTLRLIKDVIKEKSEENTKHLNKLDEDLEL